MRMAFVLLQLGIFICCATQPSVSTSTVMVASSSSLFSMSNTAAFHSALSSSYDVISSRVSLAENTESTPMADSPSALRQNVSAYYSFQAKTSTLQTASEYLTSRPFWTPQESGIMTLPHSPFVSQVSSPASIVPPSETSQPSTVALISVLEMTKSFENTRNISFTTPLPSIMSQLHTTSQDGINSITTRNTDILVSSFPSSTIMQLVDTSSSETSAANPVPTLTSHEISTSLHEQSRDFHITSTVPQVNLSLIGNTSQSGWLSVESSFYFTTNLDSSADFNSSRLFLSSSSITTSSFITDVVRDTSPTVSSQESAISHSSVQWHSLSSSVESLPSHVDSPYNFTTPLGSRIDSTLREQSNQPTGTMVTETTNYFISDSSNIPRAQDGITTSLLGTFSPSSNVMESYSLADEKNSSFPTSIRPENIPESLVLNKTSPSQLLVQPTSMAFESTEAIMVNQISASQTPLEGTISLINERTSWLQTEPLGSSSVKVMPSAEMTSNIYQSISTQIHSDASSMGHLSSMSSEYNAVSSSQIDLSGSIASSHDQSTMSPTSEIALSGQNSTRCIQCDPSTTFVPLSTSETLVNSTTNSATFSASISPSQSSSLGVNDQRISSSKTFEIATSTSLGSISFIHNSISYSDPLISMSTVAASNNFTTTLSMLVMSPSLVSRSEDIPSTDVFEYSPTTVPALSKSIPPEQNNATYGTGTKNATIVFSLKGDCSSIMGNDYTFRKFWRALSEYTQKSSSLPLLYDNISLMRVGCTPFRVVAFVSFQSHKDITDNLSKHFYFNPSNSTISFRSNNGSSLKAVVTKFEVKSPDSHLEGRDEKTLSEIVVITTAAVLCGILVILGIIIFLREYLRKRGSERFKFISGYGGPKDEHMALKTLSGIDGSNMEMQDNGSMVFDGGYSTIGSQKGRKTTFMTQADMNSSIHSKNKKGSLRKNARNASSATSSSEAKSHPMRGYGLVIGLLGYKSDPNMADTYAVPSKKSKVQGISIKSTGESSSENPTVPTDRANRKAPGRNDSPLPPPRYLRALSRHKELTDSSERLVPPSPRANDVKKKEGLSNPAYAGDEKKNDVI